MTIDGYPQCRRSPRLLNRASVTLTRSENNYPKTVAFKLTQGDITYDTEPLLGLQHIRRSPRLGVNTMSSSRNYRVNGPHDVPAIESAVQTSTTKIIESSQEAPVLIERILHFDNLPHWMQTDPHIKYGYRQELRGFAKCFWSLFYVHNEFVNTWSHLLPGVFFLALFLGTGYSILYGTAEFSKIDHLVIQIYVAGTAACLLLSVCLSFAQAPSTLYFETSNSMLIIFE